jgi:UPF0271 protein
MKTVDLNCDLGEGTGRDSELMPLITSANIACGAHAGDEATMRDLCIQAGRCGVGVGAHPGFADRQNFGRVEVKLSPAALRQEVVQQISLLSEMGTVRHVKPHGALYNLAARDRAIAEVVAGAVCEVNRSLFLFALAGSELVKAGRALGLVVAEEVFGDRSYQPDGSLTSRTRDDAVIDDERVVVAQVRQMVEQGRVRATDGSLVSVTADTICLHGDGPNAARFAQALRTELSAAGISIKRFGSA